MAVAGIGTLGSGKDIRLDYIHYGNKLSPYAWEGETLPSRKND